MAGKNLVLIFLFISLFLHLPGQTRSEYDVTKLSGQENAKPSLSLTLHPRSFLYKDPESINHTSLTHKRLASDSERVQSILSYIKSATSSFGKKTGLQAPVSSGLKTGSYEYFARLGVGTPPREFYFLVDTGSDVSWLQCRPCRRCYNQTDPIFDPSTSTSYHPLSCNGPQCSELQLSGCENEKCTYQVSYGDGSISVGDFATETLTFGNTGSIKDIALGCGHVNAGLFEGEDGLLGLGGGPLSLTSQLNVTSFSYCLVDRHSSKSSTLEFNSTLPKDIIAIPMLRNPDFDTFLYVDFEGFIIAGKKVDIPTSEFALDDTGDGGMLVDSGTAVTHLRSSLYNQLRDAFKAAARDLPPTEGVKKLFDTCFNLTGIGMSKVPTMGLVFAGEKILQLPAKNYIMKYEGKYCFSFLPMPERSTLSGILGNEQQQGMRVYHDLANSIFGFSPNKC